MDAPRVLIRPSAAAFLTIMGVAAYARVQSNSREQVVASVRPYVVQVGGKDIDGHDIKTGSGFLVARGLVVTSYSVVKRAATTWLAFSSGAVSPGTLTAVNRARTLALIRVEADRPSTLTVAAPSTTLGGDMALAIAASANGSPTVDDVRLDPHSGTIESGQVRFTRDLGPEFNGGPVLDKKGELVGVASIGADGHVNRLIPATPLGGLPNLDGFLGEQPSLALAGTVGGIESGAPSKARDRDDKAEPALPPGIVRAQGTVIQGQGLRRVEPTYPALARAARVSGAVVVEVIIDEKGDVLNARALDGHPFLRSPAEAAAMGWLFRPTTFNGAQVKVLGTITFRFAP